MDALLVIEQILVDTVGNDVNEDARAEDDQPTHQARNEDTNQARNENTHQARNEDTHQARNEDTNQVHESFVGAESDATSPKIISASEVDDMVEAIIAMFNSNDKEVALAAAKAYARQTVQQLIKKV